MSDRYHTCCHCAGQPQPDPECVACDGRGVVQYCPWPGEEEHLNTIEALAIENASLAAELAALNRPECGETTNGT